MVDKKCPHDSVTPRFLIPEYQKGSSEFFLWQLVSGLSHVGHFNMAAPLVGSQLFSPFRALGFVANHVPLTLQTQGTETLVTTAVGSAFHVYSVSIF